MIHNISNKIFPVLFLQGITGEVPGLYEIIVGMVKRRSFYRKEKRRKG